MVLTDGAPLALTIIDAGAALIRFSLDGGRWKRDAVTLGLLRPEQFAIRQAFDLAYSGGAPGFHLMFLDTEHSTARWFPFATGTEALGAEVEVPTQRDLPAQPSICEPSQRKDTPRVIVPAERGTRHAVMVTHTTEPIPVLRTQDAVLHGVPGRPCVAVYEAGLSRDTAGSTTLALVTPEATHGSWLFRRTEGSEEFDARPMTCQFDASLEVPIEVSAPTR
jgi:hypothetical protein